MKKSIIIGGLCISLLSSACGLRPMSSAPEKPQTAGPAAPNTSQEPQTEPQVSKEPASPASDEAEVIEIIPEEDQLLYITLDGESFTTYDYTGKDPAGPDTLISAISELTGWNLDRADDTTSGKGGMTVCLALSSCIFKGPPSPQKEEFHIFDAAQMSAAALGSIQKTLQNYASTVDPDSVDIYFCTEGVRPVSLAGLYTLPITEPYSYQKLQTALSEEAAKYMEATPTVTAVPEESTEDFGGFSDGLNVP